MGGWHGRVAAGMRGLRVKCYTAQFTSLTRKSCTVIYCTDCSTHTHTHWETEELLEMVISWR